MDNEEKTVPQEESAEQTEAKNIWQIQKESWYDKIPLNLKQLDAIIAVCWVLIAVTIVLIALDAMDIFHLFGA